MSRGKHARQQSPGLFRRIISILIIFALVFGVGLFSREFILIAYGVPSGSMENTIMPGDRLFAEKVSYLFRDIEPGDIVAFEDPMDSDKTLLKRCIAVGGQIVDLKKGIVYIDGVALQELYINGQPTNPLSNAISYPFLVPEGHIWVMGDNRTNSKDSRYFGSIDASTVHSRVFVTWWPFTHSKVFD